MNQLDTYTSTGAKFWRHTHAMYNFRAGDAATIISTHISPTSRCNLNCGFCSVKKRGRGNSILMSTIKEYILTLKQYGLKAVILTGGGEPLLYEHINELVGWLAYEQHLELALITNGTVSDALRPDRWGLFRWVRVSLNAESLDRLVLPTYYLSGDCAVGASVVYAGEQATPRFLADAQMAATAIGARYVRVLPDCLLDDAALEVEHRQIALELDRLGDRRFFHQQKRHRAPVSPVCHQSRFRPYLSEEPYHANGLPGTVYPCDSVVLNDCAERFETRYQLCHASNVREWIERRVPPLFDPREDCKGCVFADTVDMLDGWLRGTVDRFDDYREQMEHEVFV